MRIVFMLFQCRHTFIETVVCDALLRHCLGDEFEVQHECKLQCPHTFIIEMVITYRWVLRFYAFCMMVVNFNPLTALDLGFRPCTRSENDE